MYAISRLLLMLSVFVGLYCLAIFVALGWPATAWGLPVVAFALAARKGRRRLTTLGSARWADERDLRRNGMIDGSDGLIVGRHSSWRRGAQFANLFSRRVAARDACREFWSKRDRQKGRIVRLPQVIHTAVISPSGGGKGVSCIMPLMQTCEDSVALFDPKGEIAKLTASFREKHFKHRCVLVDPFHVVTTKPDCFNPVDFVYKDDPYAIDHCNDLGKSLVARQSDERDPHWNDSAEAWISSAIATVVYYGDRKESRSLQTVREILSHPQKLDMALKLMRESDCWGGMLARMGGQLSHFVDKERSSTLTTVSRHLRFLDTPTIAESTKTSSFDPAELRSGKMTIYLILPPEHLRANAGLLRMWISSLLRGVVRGGLEA